MGLSHKEDPLSGVIKKLPIIVSCDFGLSLLFEPGAHNFTGVHIYGSSYKFKCLQAKSACHATNKSKIIVKPEFFPYVSSNTYGSNDLYKHLLTSFSITYEIYPIMKIKGKHSV